MKANQNMETKCQSGRHINHKIECDGTLQIYVSEQIKAETIIIIIDHNLLE